MSAKVILKTHKELYLEWSRSQQLPSFWVSEYFCISQALLSVQSVMLFDAQVPEDALN